MRTAKGLAVHFVKVHERYKDITLRLRRGAANDAEMDEAVRASKQVCEDVTAALTRALRCGAHKNAQLLGAALEKVHVDWEAFEASLAAMPVPGVFDL